MVSFVSANMQDAFENIQSFKTNAINIKKNVESFSQTDTAEQTTTVSLVDEIIKKFADSYSKDNKSEDNVEQEAKNIIDNVDTDKNGTMSLDELNAFDISTVSSELGAKINGLRNQFKTYDKNNDGELCLAEVKNAIGKKQYSMQELKAMAKALSQDAQDKETVGGLSDYFFQSMVKNYKQETQSEATASFEA